MKRTVILCFAVAGSACWMTACGPSPTSSASTSRHTETPPAPKVDYKESYEEWLAERAYPNKTVDWGAWPVASAHRDSMRPVPIPHHAGSSIWTYVGPTNLPPPYRTYYGVGTNIGRVNDVAFDPLKPNVLYIASAGGGVWRSTDTGQNWTPLSNNWPSQATSSVAVHPKRGELVFVGTGDFDGGYPYSFGLMRSIDGGDNWTNIGASQFANLTIRRIMFDPDVPGRMMLTTGKGPAYWGYLYRSDDMGLTWTVALNQFAAWSDVEVGAKKPNGDRWYFASGLDYGGQVWRSPDRGMNWTKLTPPLGAGFQGSLEIAASKVDPDTVYLLVGSQRQVFKSTDAGNNWTDVTAGFPNGNNNYNWSQNSYDFYIETSFRLSGAQAIDVVYVGLIDVVQSPNGGSTWQSLGLTYTSGALTHNDQHALKAHPYDPDRVFLGNDGGAYLLNYNSVANTWSFDTSINRRLGITQFYKGDFHPTDINRMIAGTQDNATPASTGDLQNWRNVGGGDGGFAAIRPDIPNTQYATSQYLGVYRTTNNWSSSGGISPNIGADRVAFIAPIVLSPTNPDYLYAGTNYLWRYSQSANAWTARLGGQELAVSGTVRSIAVAPSDGNTIYTGSNNGEVWMTRNDGTTWTRINTGSPGLPNRFIRYIQVHPSNPTKVFVAVSGTGTDHVWRCDNTEAVTRVWTSIDGSGVTGLPDIPVQSIALVPTAPDTEMFAGTDVGVFQTTDGGATWLNATEPLGLPNVQVNDLKIVLGTDSLYAVTWGRGIWRLDLSGARTSITPPRSPLHPK
jgi:photosystem II stability/assembly factor-like uncharacterized protein